MFRGCRSLAEGTTEHPLWSGHCCHGDRAHWGLRSAPQGRKSGYNCARRFGFGNANGAGGGRAAANTQRGFSGLMNALS